MADPSSCIRTVASDFIAYLLSRYRNKRRFILEEDFQYRWRYFQSEHHGGQAKNYDLATMYSFLMNNRYIRRGMKKKLPGIIVNRLFAAGENMSFYTENSTTPSVKYFVCTICNLGYRSMKALRNHCSSGEHQQVVLNLQSAYMQHDHHGYLLCPIYLCKHANPSLEVMKDHILTAQHFRVVNCMAQGKQENNEDAEEFRVCIICALVCPNTQLLAKHQQRKSHKSQEQKLLYQLHRSYLMQDRDNVIVEPLVNGLSDGSFYNQGLLTLISSTPSVETIFHIKTSGYQSIQLFNVFSPCVDGVDIERKIFDPSISPVIVRITMAHTGKKKVPVFFTFCCEGGEFQILREIDMKYVHDKQSYANLQSNKPYIRKNYKFSQNDTEYVGEYTVIDGVRPDMNGDDLVYPVHQYVIPDFMKEYVRQYKQRLITSEQLIKMIMNHRNKEQLADRSNQYDRNGINRNFVRIGRQTIDRKNRNGRNSNRNAIWNGMLTYENYSKMFSIILHLEELEMNEEMEDFTIRDARFEREHGSNLVFLTVPGLAEKRPSVMRGDAMYATREQPPCKEGEEKFIYIGYAHHIGLRRVKLGFNVKKLVKKLEPNWRFTVEFRFPRKPLRLCHRAVEWAGDRERNLRCVLFPTEADLTREEELEEPETLDFYDEQISLNPQQKQAVQCIVMGTSRLAPYLIFGPPGTGKTVTVVEAIKQVFTANYNIKPKILVCAPQNAAADLLTERLIDNSCGAEILRLHAASRRHAEISQKVLSVSNIDDAPSDDITCSGIINAPEISKLKAYDIIVCTLIMAGRLASAGMDQHFTNIFIDEAGHATEPETMVAISGLLDVKSKAQLVLAGDPKQLGPIIQSEIAENLNLGMSLLERLMTSMPIYKRNDNYATGYDRRVVTKLVRNFRSHHAILKIPNKLFYDDELVAHADNIQMEALCNWEFLPKKGFPVIFHGLHGEDERENDSPSWFNILEVEEVMFYVKLLMNGGRVKPEDIGIITPYRKQVEKITDSLRRYYMEMRIQPVPIRVGSVEVFQGEEKKVVIISTVRSNEIHVLEDKRSCLGFVSSPKRFNVAITRAKSLLIVIGDPNILCLDENWVSFIEHCWVNEGYRGEPPPERLKRNWNENHLPDQNIVFGDDSDDEDSVSTDSNS